MPQKQSAIYTCVDRVVPARYQPARSAGYEAALQNFAAATSGAKPAALKTLDANHPIHVARMALINQKMWPNGRTLTCRFLDGDPAWQKKVCEKVVMWSQYANIAFNFISDGDADIRISFSADAGSWSAIGTDCLVESYFPKYQPTMNFGWLRGDTADDEYERVVVHEFGHALGCIHEHQSPNETLSWNTDAVYRYFSGPPNYWSNADIDSNVLQKYSPEGITATRFDMDSIMLYQFDGSLFQDGVGTPLNKHLSTSDTGMVSLMYPRS
jgi:hypothetical protein